MTIGNADSFALAKTMTIIAVTKKIQKCKKILL